MSRSGDEKRRPLVEVLSFDGCPNRAAAVELVERVSAELGVEPDLRLVNVAEEDVVRERFLGSPTVRVEGRDIEPEADARTDFTLASRVHRTEQGFHGEPDERRLRDALIGAGRARSSESG